MSVEIGEEMTAAVYNNFNGIENEGTVTIQTVPVPKQLSKNQVLIKVHAAAINPVDWKMIKGNMAMILGNKFPRGIGFDFAGEVVAIGSACKRIQVGDAVWGMGHFSETGTCAEYYRTNESYVGIKPQNLSWQEAASIPLVALTSYQGLHSQVKTKAGHTVLVLGASGGTGLAAVQIAKAAGARVFAVCSGRNAELVKDFGADEVVDYTVQNWWEVWDGANVDVIYDTIGGFDTWTRSWKVLHKNGNFVTIAGDSQEEKLSIPVVFQTVGRVVNRKFWSNFTTPNYYNFATSTNYVDLDKIAALVAQNKFRTLIDSEFSLNDTLEALKRNKTQRCAGKVVININ